MSIIQSTAKSGGTGGFYDYPIEQSLRFDGASYLSRTFGSGDRKTWTWSGWVKLSDLGTSEQYIFQSSDAITGTARFSYKDNALKFEEQSGGTNVCTSTSLYRDVSSWYHIVVSYNTLLTNNTIKFYVNGDLLTLSGSTLATNTLGYINYSSFEHRLGAYTGNSDYFNGYLANIQFIDGQALDASYFGETKDDIWVPKAYTGSYGTNGFHLDFADSSNIGNDVSGNNNDWTVN